MKQLLTTLLVLSLSTAAFSQRVFYNKCSSGDTLRFRFELPHKMKLKIYRNNTVIKEYEFKGTKDLEMITKLKRVVVYANEFEMRFYLIDEFETIVKPRSMNKQKLITF